MSSLSAGDQKALAKIREHGWVIRGVSDLGCDHTDHPHRHTGRDPYLYTAGLTEAGLPELLLRLAGKNSLDWMHAGTRVLNTVAAHTLHEELTVGQTLPTGIGSIEVTVKEPPLISNADDGIWPGLAYRLYGRRRVQVLEIEANW